MPVRELPVNHDPRLLGPGLNRQYHHAGYQDKYDYDGCQRLPCRDLSRNLARQEGLVPLGFADHRTFESVDPPLIGPIDTPRARPVNKPLPRAVDTAVPEAVGPSQGLRPGNLAGGWLLSRR